MTRHVKAGLALCTFLLLAGWLAWPAAEEPAPPNPEEERERQIIQRFVTVLEKNPRRGTALDRIYGYHVERGNLDAFIKQYAERTKKEPTDGTAWMVLGLLESQRGRDANAVAAFREAEKHLPENPLASYYLGQSLVLVGQPDAAAEAFERAISRKPTRTDLLDIFQALGRVYQRAQKTEKALAVWSRLEEFFPDDRRVQEQIASTLAEEGQFDQALPRYEKLAAGARDPYQKATFRMEAAELKVRLKQTAKALEDFEGLLGELNPDSWLHREVRRKIEDVFLRNDDLAGLAKYYEGWLKKNPGDVDAIARLAHTLAGQGRLPESRSWLEKGIAQAPTRKELRQALVEQLVFEQKYADAAAQYEAMDKNDPNNPDILREWGKLLLRDTAKPEAERKKAAVAVWKRLLDKRPKDPVVTAQVADLVRGAGMTDEAVALYKRAIELAPDAAQYREYLGEYYHSLKRGEEALATWRPIAEGANRNAKNLTRLGEVLNGFGYKKEALAVFADALTLEKDDFNLLLRYADLLHQDGRHDDALKQLDAAAKLIGNAEEAEAVLQAQIQIYQSTDTLAARTEELKKELDAPSPQPLSPGGRGARGEGLAERWHRLARYYEAARQMAEATTAIGKALQKDPKSVPILASAARIHEAGGNLLLAADTNRKLAAIDRRFRTEYLTAVAKLEARLGRRAEALQAGRDLLAAAPGNPDHYKFFAELCFQLGENEEGLESLRRSVRANPSEPQGLITLANALAERYRTGEAVELLWRAFEKSNELEGKLGVIGRLAELYLQNNQFDRLLERLERERREADKQREMTICLAQAYQSAGDLGTARQQLERLLAENPRDTQLLQQLSILAENEGDAPLALKYQRQWEKAAPTNRDARLRLAQLLVKAGESDEAAEVWVKLVADEPEPHRTLQAIDALLANAKPETALAVTSRLLAQKPGDWELLYREGVALAALKRPDEAARRFQALLDLRLPDDQPGAALKASKKEKPRGMTAATPARSSFLPEEIPVEMRTQNIWEIRAFTGMDPRYGYWVASQQRTWTPRDYGQGRVGALGWLLGFAQQKDRADAFLKEHQPGKGPAGDGTRAAWDWYYLQMLRQDQRQVFEAARALARTSDPSAQYAYLNALAGRTAGSRVIRRPGNNGPDNAPPLPAAQLDEVLNAFRRLRQQKPEWLTTAVLNNVLTELKRGRRPKDEEQVYRDAVAVARAAGQAGPVLHAIALAGERGDLDTTLALFDKLDKLEGAGPRSLGNLAPTRQATAALGDAMKARAEAKAHADVLRILNVYLASQRRHSQAAGRPTSASNPGMYQANYSVWVGRNRRMVQIDYPQPNDYFDAGAIGLLRNAFELFRHDDVLSDLFAQLRGQLDKASAPEKVYLHLARGYLHWWNHEREQALAELAAASDLVPADVNLHLEVALLRESNNEPEEALAVLDSITPLDHAAMQRREIAALRLAVRTGNVARARTAADRLFGLRLDAETQVQLAAQMHQLGMHEPAEKVLARAARQAGHRTAALIRLMHQYQNQNQPDLAVQIARDLLRKAPAPSFLPYYNPQSDGRSEAIAVLARSGKLTEMIGRAEAQLASSPKSIQLLQALLDFYRAAGDKDKVKDTAERMAKVRPDDGKLRFQIAQTMQQMGDSAAAADHYRAAIRKEPMLFAYRYWEIENVFSQAKKSEDLIGLLEEIDIRAMGGNYWAFMNMLQPLFAQEKTRAQGLKLFRKVWEAFPNERQFMLGSLYQDDIWQLPELYEYARQAIIPRGDDPVEPWKGSDQVISYGGDGRVTGVVTRLLEVARKQNRLGLLRREVEQALASRPEWGTGKALLVLLDLQRSRVAEARKGWRELLDDKKNPMPMWTRFIFGQELADYDALRDLALETYEGTVEEALNDTNMDFSYHPLGRLVNLYKEMGRRAEARALLLKFSRPPVYEYDPGYAAYRRIQNTVALGNYLTQMDYPVDAVRLCSELVDDNDTLTAATNWNGPWMKEQAEQGLTSALQSLKPENLPAAVHDLLTPRTEAKGNGDVLDLVMLVRPRDLPDARLMSLMEKALRSTAKKPALQAEARAALTKLAAEHPKDFSVLIAAALEAFVEDKAGPIADAVQHLLELVDASPLEELAEGRRANARQRAEAARQIGLWLVARQCLRRPELRGRGEKLGERAVEAARRQLEPHFALAVLREWGQMELDRGDRAAAEKRWARMLEITLPPPATKRAAQTPAPTSPPANGREKSTRGGGEQGAWFPRSAWEPVLGRSASRLIMSRNVRFRAAPDAERPGSRFPRGAWEPGSNALAFAAPPAATVPPARVVPASAAPAPAPHSQVSVIALQQFEQAAKVAALAAEEKMFALSLRAIHNSLRGGPPVVPKQTNPRLYGGPGVAVAGGAQLPGIEEINRSSQQVASTLDKLVALWRRQGVPAADLYATLADVVLPAARPGEVFLYNQGTTFALDGRQRSVGILLAEAAVQAGRLDDLRRRVEARQAQPLGELNARVLLAQVALAAGDHARVAELLARLEQRLQKDTVQQTAEVICQVAVPALGVPQTTPAAQKVLERAAKNLSGAADQQAIDLLLLLARHDFDHGKPKEGRARLKEIMGIAVRTMVRSGAQQYQIQQMQRAAEEYIRAGLVADVLDLFALAVDLPAEQRGQIPADTFNSLAAGFGRQFAARPAKERYESLKSWTFPYLLRRSVRVMGAFVPSDAPPPAFGKFAPPPDGASSNIDLLINAAREAGKLDELAAETEKLAARKGENAIVLHLLVQIACGKGETVEADVKKHLEDLRKKATAPPPPQPMYYRGGPEQNGTPVEWPDFLLARACLGDPKLREAGESMARLLIPMAQKTANWPFLTHLRAAVAASRAAAPTDPGLARWHPGDSTRGTVRLSGVVPARWVVHEGHVAHLFGPDQDFLLFDYPLTGSFEFSVDAYQGGWAEGHVGYGGLVFETGNHVNGNHLVWPVGHHEQVGMTPANLHGDAFNRFTLQVEPGKVRFLVNGRQVHEIKDLSPTSPWLALYSNRERHTVFRNPRFRGSLQVPREVRLSHGDRLEGWMATFYNESQPNRLSKPQSIEDDEDAPKKRASEMDAFDWYARDGEIHGRRNPEATASAGGHLAYFRPLRPEETLSYEFFSKPGEFLVHPSLGRVAFLLGPDRVRLHWLTENGGYDWTGLPLDNAVDAGGLPATPLPLKAGDWNTLRLSLTENAVKLELNGTAICEHTLAPGDDRTFGLFHYKGRTAARVRNVVLTGAWPEKLVEKDLEDPFSLSAPEIDGVARRALIGEPFFLLDAATVLQRARALPVEQGYELLRAWVLPGAGHAVFQMAGEFTPADAAPPVARTPLPAGRRVQAGGDLEAPALELVALAQKLGKLDDLAERVAKTPADRDPRGRWAMLALVRAAQGRDEEAVAALKELQNRIAKAPLDEPVWKRWPELVAATGTMGRPGARGGALTLLDVMVKRLEEGITGEVPLPDRDTWLRRVRHARALAQVLGLPAGQRAAFGADPGLEFWAPVSHCGAQARGSGFPRSHWSLRDGVLTHYPGRDQDYLYLRMPLRGDFEVRCELTTFGWREAHVAYGGLRLDLKHTRKTFDLYSFDRRVRTGIIDPPLPQLGDWYRFRLVVKGETCTVYVNDRKLCEEPLAADADPWLMLHADHQCTAGFRNLTIVGKPAVPESLPLCILPDLTGWLSYYGSGWEKRGDEIVNRGGRREPTPDEPTPPRTWQEQALHYHRPLLEDGVIEYEFYYEPEKVHAHPVLDRLAFLLEPEGVRIHWLTDGAHERTSLAPDNAAAEPKNRRGPDRLPLKPKAWNRLKLALAGDTVTLHLNEIEIYRRELESTNQRTFGVFHYADATDLRVRNVTYRGNWPRTLPAADALLAPAR